MTTTLTWDPRLDERGARYYPIGDVAEGTTYYRLVRAQWLDEVESQGKHHIHIDVWDENGNRLIGLPVYLFNGGVSKHLTEAKQGEPYSAAIPMYNAGHAYAVQVGDASDRVDGMGLGSIQQPYTKLHTGYALIFQRTTAGVDEPPPPPTADWSRVLRMVRELEAELSTILEGRDG